MLDKRLLWTGVSVVAVVMVAVVAAALPDRSGVIPSADSVSDIEIEEDIREPEPERPAWMYLLREHSGRIGIFFADSGEPEMVLDVMVRHLPEYDRKLLEDGIEVYSYAELVSLIEDYSS